ncbi:MULTISPECIES: hypothetical protein [unclassified Brevundimonas]|uniref:hypothetical protein n=1 Tax=unclassified Brevundimonas TaxID=2622653 RepID=UPI000CFBC027|nr:MULTISPECIES: hypothetical protein [unclassified Brevundimonas]PQZ82851.1 hypothetical protein CQ026_07610 [Brevundimonas sp. MYb31]PRB16753.1 hypothetical protein CQ039_03600 [Brevundimonas sp. MYb52]PRB34710.1 hypothetical protein CQ035_10130 [Brevundimonas sp. MYb46]
MIKLNRRLALLGGLSVAGCASAPSSPATVSEFSLALQGRLPRQPPLLAVFEHGDQTLGFVAARHAIDGGHPTFALVRTAFDEVQPRAVIIEGIETARGEWPRPILEEARRLKAAPDPASAGEALYTAQLAMERDLPLWGGEPSDQAIYAALLAAGSDPQDAFYASLFGPLEQSRREGDITGPSDPRFDPVFERWARWSARDLKPQPDASVGAFRAWYRDRTGLDLNADPNWLASHDPDYAGPVQRENKLHMKIRDQHLLDLIRSRLDTHRRVLVVYGGSHIATMWNPLVRQLGQPHLIGGA